MGYAGMKELELRAGNGRHYTIELVEGCHILRGDISVHELSAVLRRSEEDEIPDYDLADRMGVAMVIGNRDNLKRLRGMDLPISPKREAEAHMAIEKGLPELAAWLRTGDRCRASDAMCKRIFGILDVSVKEYPKDGMEFRKCLEFVEATGCYERLPEMSDVSREWNVIVNGWEQICSYYHLEVESLPHAPSTRKLIRELLNLRVSQTAVS